MIKKILYVGTNEIDLNDIPDTINGLGYEVLHKHYDMMCTGYVYNQDLAIRNDVTMENIDMVISNNFSETIATACNILNKPYLSWIYDAPQKELYTSSAFYDTNYIFVFDKCEMRRLKNIGIPHVYYTPLAVKANFGNEYVRDDTFVSDVTMIGQLYGNDYLERVIETAPTNAKVTIDKMLNTLLFNWERNGRNSDYLDEEAINYLREVKGQDVTQLYPYMKEQHYYESALISRVLARRERVGALNRLSDIASVSLVTYDKDLRLLDKRINVVPGVGYNGQVASIYKNSKINLNITLHCIESGVNQRIFDVMASGGFVLSNYQPELEELFEIGSDIVVFHNMNEMMELVKYYLCHEDERINIARNGERKVKERYTYDIMLANAIDQIERNDKIVWGLSDFVTCITNIVYYVRIQNYSWANAEFRNLISNVSMSTIMQQELIENHDLYSLINKIIEAQEFEDMILVADLLKEGLLPILKEIFKLPSQVKIGQYVLEPTSSGYYTIKNILSGNYLHSNCDPMEEARVLVEKVIDVNQSKYVVWGCGLGYHIMMLHKLLEGAVNIEVYEEDEKIIEIARSRGVFSILEREGVTIQHDPQGVLFTNAISTNGCGVFLHYPSILKIQNKALQNALKQFFLGWNSTLQLSSKLKINYNKNISAVKSSIDSVLKLNSNEEILIIGGGPSVTDWLPYLNIFRKNKIVLCVTTALKKVLEAGIIPDYAIVMDAGAVTLNHIVGMNEIEVPLILSTTAYWEFTERFSTCYLACQKGFELSEQLAKKNGWETYETGSTVVSLAIQVALKAHARAIYMLGIDMAFPNGHSHLLGGALYQKKDLSGLKMVDSVVGGLVATDELFIKYRRWIEKTIENNSQCRFYNMSAEGAVIKGSVHYPLSDFMAEHS